LKQLVSRAVGFAAQQQADLERRADRKPQQPQLPRIALRNEVRSVPDGLVPLRFEQLYEGFERRVRAAVVLERRRRRALGIVRSHDGAAL